MLQDVTIDTKRDYTAAFVNNNIYIYIYIHVYILQKTNVLLWQSIWLLQLCDYIVTMECNMMERIHAVGADI